MRRAEPAKVKPLGAPIFKDWASKGEKRMKKLGFQGV